MSRTVALKFTHTKVLNPRINSIKKLSEEFQFKILIYSNNIDRDLTMIICMELAKEWSEMVNFIDHYQNVIFSRKIKLVNTILKSNYPDIYEKYPDVFIQIGQIKAIRNKIAHFLSSYLANDDGSKTWFVLSPLIVRENENKEQQLSEEEMRGFMEMVEICSSNVREIMVLVGKKHDYTL